MIAYVSRELSMAYQEQCVEPACKKLLN